MSDSAGAGPLQNLIESLRKLPGIGPRSAERIAFHLLKAEPQEAFVLADAVRAVKERLRPCSRCFNLADGDLCPICTDSRRDPSIIVVVEQPKDVISLESTGLVHGVYHVLMGSLAPLDGVHVSDLTIAGLIERVQAGGVEEVILATNPTFEGDATALHIQDQLRELPVRVTRLARGLAPGGHIEYANRSMLEEALRGRRDVASE